MILQYLFFFLHLTFAALVLFLLISFLTGAPFVPSKKSAAAAMINLARLKPGMKVADLGSGDGRILFGAAQKGAQAIGFEINPFLVIFTWLKAQLTPYRQLIHVHWQNLWTADVRNVDVVFVYLLPWRMEKLKRKLEKELKSGSLVISNSFIFPGWPILRQDKTHHIFVFKI